MNADLSTQSILKTWLRVLAVNTLLGWIPALLAVMFTKTSWPALRETALTGALYSNLIGIPCWLILPGLLERAAGWSWRARSAATIGVLAGCAIAGCTAANLILVAAGVVPIGQFFKVMGWTLRFCLLITVTYGLLTSAMSTLEYKLRQKEASEAEARKTAAEARFASLESRVHPHFLFNTLNSISALVREDPAMAEQMIDRLSALLRFSLDSELAGLVPLREELRIVQDYLEIERVRFGDRLRFVIETGAGTEGRGVPPLSVQTLVENSVKYAVGTKREGAEIHVRTWLEGDRLKVEVSDDGPGFDPALRKPGHGLDLLERRLTALFGPAGTLSARQADGRMFVEMLVA